MKKHEVSNSRVYLRDCMEAMAEFPDNHFDLAVVDPPYGINHAEIAGKQGGAQYGKAAAAKKKYTTKKWDNEIPPPEYFEQIFRVSKDQIIFGANYMVQYLKPSMGWIFWDKNNGSNGFSDGELAFTSFKRGLRKVKVTWNGMIQQNMKNKEQRFHPTQKPVALYDWIFAKYATPGMKILDTHLGSGSSRISAQKAGMDFWGYEIDEEYFTAHCKRFDIFYSQGRLF